MVFNPLRTIVNIVVTQSTDETYLQSHIIPNEMTCISTVETDHTSIEGPPVAQYLVQIVSLAEFQFPDKHLGEQFVDSLVVIDVADAQSVEVGIAW